MWVTQMNHIVMEIDLDHYRDWFSSQVRGGKGSHGDPGELPHAHACTLPLWIQGYTNLPYVLPIGSLRARKDGRKTGDVDQLVFA